MNDDKALFVETVMTAVAPDTVTFGTTATQAPTVASTSKALGLPVSTVRRQLKLASAKRKAIMTNNNMAKWSQSIKKWKGCSRTAVTPAMQVPG